MDEYESLSHSKWECKYHVVFIPKGRRKALYGELRKYLGEVFRRKTDLDTPRAGRCLATRIIAAYETSRSSSFKRLAC